MDQKAYGAIEFGGTKTICAIGKPGQELIDKEIFETASVKGTLQKVYGFFERHDSITALGVGAFGPLNLDVSSPDYGAMRNTPKPGWENVDIHNILKAHFAIPVAIDLDVNCAALGELHYGNAKGVDNFVYLTLGTGIGGSLVINKKPVHGLLNTEMGHIAIPHEPFSDGFLGACPYHGDCFEGIASGSAMNRRYGKKAELITDQAIWDEEISYISRAISNIMLTVSPKKIIIGGGLTNHPGLIEGVRASISKQNNNYLPFPDPEDYIVQSMGDSNGVLGAIILASQESQTAQ